MSAHTIEHPMQKSGSQIPGIGVTLDAIFSGTEGAEPRPQPARLRVLIISQGGVPRWVLPENTRRVVTVLKSWKPYKWKSRLQWNAVVGACRMNVLGALPGIARANLNCDLSYWRSRMPAYSGSWSIAAYVGNPFYTRKALLFFVDERARVRAVAKVPIYAAAKRAILNEAKVLQGLRDKLPLPRVIFADEEKGIAAQSWIEGMNLPRKFGPKHLVLLTGFAQEGARVRLSDCREEIGERLAQLDGVDAPLLSRALSLLDVRDELRACVEHGDFVPWNLRRLADGQLTLIDWEWAQETGYPWQDICRYFYLQDYLFRERADVWKALNANSLLQEYRRRFELSPDAVRGLTIRYLLLYLCEEHAEGNRDRVDYAQQEIRQILDATE